MVSTGPETPRSLFLLSWANHFSCPNGTAHSQVCLYRNVVRDLDSGVCESLPHDPVHYYPGRRALGVGNLLPQGALDPELGGVLRMQAFALLGQPLCFRLWLPCSFLLPRVLAATPFPILVNFTSAIPLTSLPGLGPSTFVENQNFFLTLNFTS